MKTNFRKTIAALTAAFILLCTLPAGIFAEEEIPIDEAHFPDANFREFILTGCWDNGEENSKIDIDGSGTLSPDEIAAVKEINVSGRGIHDMTGIEYFPELPSLVCSDNHLTVLDVSNNTNLWHLGCSFNELTSIDVSNNTALTVLECSFNKLNSLDISNNSAVFLLSCSGNRLENLDLSGNNILQELYCSDNRLSDLDISNNPDIFALECSHNQLKTLDVSNNPALTWLFYCDNPLSDPYQPLETFANENSCLEALGCGGLGLTEIDLSPYTGLEHIDCSENQLTELDLSSNQALWMFDCSNNKLNVLDVSSNTNLYKLDCSGNQLTSLDLSNHKNLDEFSCTGNKYHASSDPFDLNMLPGNFDISKASDWKGCNLNGSTVDFTAGFATYTYNCGGGHSAVFKLYSPDYTPLPGDYDDDGSVTVQDALMIVRAAMKLIVDDIPDAADYNGDGIIDMQDAVMALSAAIGIG